MKTDMYKDMKMSHLLQYDTSSDSIQVLQYDNVEYSTAHHHVIIMYHHSLISF